MAYGRGLDPQTGYGLERRWRGKRDTSLPLKFLISAVRAVGWRNGGSSDSQAWQAGPLRLGAWPRLSFSFACPNALIHAGPGPGRVRGAERWCPPRQGERQTGHYRSLAEALAFKSRSRRAKRNWEPWHFDPSCHHIPLNKGPFLG